MGLPIALGTKKVSTHDLSPPEPVEEFDRDGTVLYPSNTNDLHRQTCCVACSPQLQAVVTISYYDMMRRRHDSEDNGRSHKNNPQQTQQQQQYQHTVAELRVQVSPAAATFSKTAYRETVFRLPLPSRQATTSTSTTKSQPAAQAVFSADRRFLTCLIPYPADHHHTAETVLVVFQLRRPRESGGGVASPRSARRPPPPPLPSYIQSSLPSASSAPSPSSPTGNDGRSSSTVAAATIVPVATNPRVVKEGTSGQWLQQACCICDASFLGNNSSNGESSSLHMLLAGCGDGSIRAISYRPVSVLAVVHHAAAAATAAADKWSARECITRMHHAVTDSSEQQPRQKQQKKQSSSSCCFTGRLAVLNGAGEVTIFELQVKRALGDNNVVVSSQRTNAAAATTASTERLLQQRASSSDNNNGDETAASNTPTALAFSFDQLHKLQDGPFVALQWITAGGGSSSSSSTAGPASYLAVMERPGETCRVQVWSLRRQDRRQQQQRQEGAATTSPTAAAAASLAGGHGGHHYHYSTVLVSEICLTRDGLEETMHTRLATTSSPCTIATDADVVNAIVSSSSSSLDYDASSDCLALSSCLYKTVGASIAASATAADDNHLLQQPQPQRQQREASFAVVWNWRSNTQGLTMARLFRKTDHQVQPDILHRPKEPAGPLLLSSIFTFARDNRTNALHLSYMTASSSSSSYGQNTAIRKDLFPAGVISPTASRSGQATGLDRPTALIVSAETVTYPKITKQSARRDYQVDWEEAPVPHNYQASFGTATVATMGRKWGRSVAIAASACGMCTLDIPHFSTDDTTTTTTTTTSTRGLQPPQPKWYLFASATEERSFRVMAMAWWEGKDKRESRDDLFYDDLVVAIVQVMEGRDRGYYLSCWSKKRLGVGHQLCKDHHHNDTASSSTSTSTTSTSWGVRLPRSFCPNKLDLLDPGSMVLRNSRKAVVLLSDDNCSTDYHVYQLQVVSRQDNTNSSRSYAEKRPYEVLARRASHGQIGGRVHLFLSGASFAYDLTHHRSSRHMEDYVVTLGVIRLSNGGMDALALSSRGVTHVGQLLADHDGRGSEVSSYWFSDIVSRNESHSKSDIDGFVWTVHLMNGKLLRWTVPCAVDADGLNTLIQSAAPKPRKYGSYCVHQKSIRLGLVCKAGSAPKWMLRSASTTGTEFPIGPLRSSSFASMVGTSQECHKLYRSLGEDFESHMFRPDFLDHEVFCPGALAIYPPTFVAPLFSFLVDSVVSLHDGGFVYNYVKSKLSNASCFESSMMAIQLLSLRLVEAKAAASKNKEKETKSGLPSAEEMFNEIVQSVRHHATPLQFAALFLEVGRQLEPSCFPHMFPLAGIPGGGTEDCESLEDLFKGTLEQGSVSLAIAALPLFSDYDVTLSSCRAIFRLCLARLGHAIQCDRENIGNLKEETESLGDMFRYVVKLEDTGSLDVDVAATSEDYYSDEENEEVKNMEQRSLFCGLSRWFGPRASASNNNKEETAVVDAAASFIVDGFHQENGIFHPEHRGSIKSGKSHTPKENVGSIATKYLLATAFPKNRNDSSWSDSAKIAALLVGDMSARFRLASRSLVAKLIETTRMTAFDDLVHSHNLGRGGYSRVLAQCISACEAQVDPTQAGAIFNLALILLDRVAHDGGGGGSRSGIAGLLLVTFVSGHASGRIEEIMEENADSSPLMASYLDAQFELSHSRVN